jgi:hypothetical protein
MSVSHRNLVNGAAMSFEEIALATGVPLCQVHAAYYRGIRKLLRAQPSALAALKEHADALYRARLNRLGEESYARFD